MASAAHLRASIEAALAQRMHAPLTLGPRLVAPGIDTGFETLDAVLRGGFPLAGTTEIAGARSSGRTSIAAAYIAQRTRLGHLCAWVDVGLEMDPEACQANGADLARLLLIRCAGTKESVQASAQWSGQAPGLDSGQAPAAQPRLHAVEHISAAKKYRKDKSIGTPGVANRPFHDQHEAASTRRDAASTRKEQVASDRLPARRGVFVLEQKAQSIASECTRDTTQAVSAMARKAHARKPWGRMEQGIKAVDLLLQTGGFGAIVFDLGGIAPQFAQRIPLATWFRWRAALERSRTSLIVLSQVGCTGSSAELALRVQAEVPHAGTVMTDLPYRLEVVRRRFAEGANTAQAGTSLNIPPHARKGPQCVSTSMWNSRTTWVRSGEREGKRGA